MRKIFGCLIISAVFLCIPWVFAQDSNQTSSDSGVLVSSPDDTQVADQDIVVNNGKSNVSSLSDQVNSNQDMTGNNNNNSQTSVSSTDPVIVKSTNVVMFQITQNMKLTQDQVDAVRVIIEDYEIKVRALQLSLENGTIDSKTMYDQRQQLMDDEDRKLGAIFNPDQMNVWINIQDT